MSKRRVDRPKRAHTRVFRSGYWQFTQALFGLFLLVWIAVASLGPLPVAALSGVLFAAFVFYIETILPRAVEIADGIIRIRFLWRVTEFPASQLVSVRTERGFGCRMRIYVHPNALAFAFGRSKLLMGPWTPSEDALLHALVRAQPDLKVQRSPIVF